MYGDVILTRDIPSTACAPATSVLSWRCTRYRVVSEEGYSVEFFDMARNTVAVATLPASALRQPTAADRPAVRQLSA